MVKNAAVRDGNVPNLHDIYMACTFALIVYICTQIAWFAYIRNTLKINMLHHFNKILTKYIWWVISLLVYLYFNRKNGINEKRIPVA